MFECEKCLHGEVCDRSSRQMWAMMGAETECGDFKDASEFVPVVRCRDCKYHVWDDDVDYVCIHIGKYMGFDDFCSHGERKKR